MNKDEITRRNIQECGYYLGKAVRGKGTQVLDRPRHICTEWSLDSEDKDLVEIYKKEICEKIEKYGVDKVFIQEIRITTGTGSQSFNFEGQHMASRNRFPVAKMLEDNFNGVEYVSVYSIPVLKAYVKMSSFNASLGSQQDMVRKLIYDAEGRSGIDCFTDSSYDEMDNQISFSSRYSDNSTWEYNGDYTLFHGPSICADDSEVERIDGRIYNYNEAAVDDFWNFTIVDEDPFSWVDPDNRVSVYARKGKDWYVTSGVVHEQIFLTYRDENGELVEDEEFWYFANTADDELVGEVERLVRNMKTEVEVRSIINNELHYGNWSGYADYEHNSICNYILLAKHFSEDELEELRWEILDLVDWKTNGPPESMVEKAYEKFMLSNIDDKEWLFGKYRHLEQLRRIVEDEGKELVYSQVIEFSEHKQWAIKYKNEEYHFFLSELYKTGPRKFYEIVSSNIAKRRSEKIEKDTLMRKAARVFVGLEDSVNSGNCKSGTKAFCDRFDIDTVKIGGIRGDTLLALDYSPFTRRAVAMAVKERVA